MESRVRLEEFTSSEVAAILEDRPRRSGVVLPIGALEQHGPNLPLGCDTAIARGAAENLARSLIPSRKYHALVMPDITYTPVPGAESTPGTVSVGFDVLGTGLQEILRGVSRTDWDFAVLLNAHAQNHGRVIEAGMAATGGVLGRRLPVVVIHVYEYASLCADFGLAPGRHAGEFELALLHHYRGDIPWAVETDAGHPAPRPRPANIFGLELMPRSRRGVLADAPPDRDAVLKNAGAMGRRLDAALLDCLVTNLDLYFGHWHGVD